MFQVMAELEGLSARLAARRISKEEILELRRSDEACRRHAKAGQEDAFFDANSKLHDTILLASRNKFLIEKVHELRRRVDPYRRYVTKQPGVMDKSVEEHAAFVAAIEAGNGPAAHDLMRSHLNMLGGEAGDFIAFLSGIGHSTPTLSKKMPNLARKAATRHVRKNGASSSRRPRTRGLHQGSNEGGRP
jgi:DNA-binding GntR family transcriptional regulator